MDNIEQKEPETDKAAEALNYLERLEIEKDKMFNQELEALCRKYNRRLQIAQRIELVRLK